jgi:Bacterial capsule synthesis protein PGA_cap
MSKRSRYPKLFFPAHYLSQLQTLNFSVLGVANNHSLDEERPDGPLQSSEVLNNLGFLAPGISFEPVTRQVNDVSFAIFAVTTFLNPPLTEGSVALVTPENWGAFLTAVRRWSEKVDYVVVMIHWGNDYQRSPSKRIRLLAKELFEAGARIIYGNHPHILWPVEQPEPGRIVCYSLGNFSQVIGCPSIHPLAPVYFKALTSGILTLEINKKRILPKFQLTRTVENIDQWLRSLEIKHSYWLWNKSTFEAWYKKIETNGVRLLSEIKLFGSNMLPPNSMKDIDAFYSA